MIFIKVIEYNDKIYYLKLSVKKYIAIHQLGLIERLASYPTVLDYVSFCTIIMDEYNFNQDEIYDFMDFLVDDYGINKLFTELLLDSGIISDSKEHTEALDDDVNNLSTDTSEPPTSDYMTFEEQLKPLLQDCLAYGMDVDTFYNMTLKELEIYSDGIKERIKRENHDKAMFDYALANLISIGTGKVLGGKSKYPSFENYYGKMLGEEEANMDDLELEGYADGVVPVYRKKINNVEDDLVRKQLLALVQAQNISSINKNKDRNGVE